MGWGLCIERGPGVWEGGGRGPRNDWRRSGGRSDANMALCPPTPPAPYTTPSRHLLSRQRGRRDRGVATSRQRGRRDRGVATSQMFRGWVPFERHRLVGQPTTPSSSSPEIWARVYILLTRAAAGTNADNHRPPLSLATIFVTCLPVLPGRGCVPCRAPHCAGDQGHHARQWPPRCQRAGWYQPSPLRRIP